MLQAALLAKCGGIQQGDDFAEFETVRKVVPCAWHMCTHVLTAGHKTKVHGA